MLSRVANNLYWMGRYLERSEHLARYTKVQYFSLYDAPHLQSIDFVLSSIVNMTGIDYDISETPIDEQDVIHEVGLARSNYSIFSYVLAARENARSARNVLSDELWEVINQYYRFVQEYDPDYFKVRGLFEFTYEVNKHCQIIKSTISHTMLHKLSWMIISLGIYLERTVQLLRTLQSKLTDIKFLTMDEPNTVLERYQWTTALKIMEAFDIYRRFIKRQNSKATPVDFLIWDKTFPRSVLYSLSKVDELITAISAHEGGHGDIRFHSGKLHTKVRYSTKEETQHLSDYLNSLLDEVSILHQLIDRGIFHNTEEMEEDSQEGVQVQLQSQDHQA